MTDFPLPSEIEGHFRELMTYSGGTVIGADGAVGSVYGEPFAKQVKEDLESIFGREFFGIPIGCVPSGDVILLKVDGSLAAVIHDSGEEISLDFYFGDFVKAFREKDNSLENRLFSD